MKKRLVLMLVSLFMLGMPGMTIADNGAAKEDHGMMHDMQMSTEEFGQGFFMYLGGLMEYPVHVLEQGVRTLLFMDK